MKDNIKALRSLKPTRNTDSRRRLAADVARECIRAYRRGVSMEEIAKAAGRKRANLYSLLGSYALHNCTCVEEGK